MMAVLSDITRRKISKRRILELVFGGHWTYRGFLGWVSDDGRFVTYISNGVDEYDNPIPGPFRCCLYGHGETRWINWNKLKSLAIAKLTENQ
jgi:hypothetical protein